MDKPKAEIINALNKCSGGNRFERNGVVIADAIENTPHTWGIFINGKLFRGSDDLSSLVDSFIRITKEK